MSVPAVSILVPMRNAEDYIEAALRSLMDQGVDLEIIVIDDGSTDRSAEIVNGLGLGPVRIIEGPKAGISAALNRGLEEVKTPLVARCDADDLYVKGRLGRQKAWLDAHPEYVAICGAFLTITPSGAPAASLNLTKVPKDITQDLLNAQAQTHLCTYLMRASAVRQAGGFRTWFKTAEDIDFQLRLAEVGPIFYTPEVGYEYRLHDQSITHQENDARRLFYEESAREFARQRKSQGQDALEQGSPPEPPTAEGTRRRSSAEHVQQMLLRSAWQAHREGDKSKAIHTGWQACLARPQSIRTWKSFVLLIARRAGV